MNIGVPKEIKNNENRVGLVPSGVRQLSLDGHQVFIESGAGLGIGIEDKEYTEGGATIVKTPAQIFEKAEMIVKVKEPQPQEISLITSRHILYAYLHLAAEKELTKALMKTRATCIAYETIQMEDGSLPLLNPMSEVAGRMATQVGATYLQLNNKGKGILLGGVPGVRRGRVTILGCGVAGTNAIKMAMGLGAEVVAIDLNIKRLVELDDLFDTKITTLFSNISNIEQAVRESDLVIGAVLIPGAKAPKLVTRQMIRQMEKGSVVVDIAVDQGGCIETCRPTTHEDPTYHVDGITHYCVANMPAAVASTSTYALTNTTLQYARMIARKGVRKAALEDKAFQRGINIYQGNLVYQSIARDLHIPYTPLELNLKEKIA